MWPSDFDCRPFDLKYPHQLIIPQRIFSPNANSPLLSVLELYKPVARFNFIHLIRRIINIRMCIIVMAFLFCIYLCVFSVLFSVFSVVVVVLLFFMGLVA